MLQNDLELSQNYGNENDYVTAATDYYAEVNHTTQEGYNCGLTPAEEAALEAMEREYQAEREKEQQIIKAELDRKYNESLRQKFEHYILTAKDPIPAVTPIVKRFDKIICSEGNISAVVGEAKSKKTFLCTAIVAAMLDHNGRQLFGIEHNNCKVLWIDTEQSRAHIQRVLWRINNICELPHDLQHPKVNLLALREEAPAARLDIMHCALEYYKPKLVIVDGISDLMCNTNNLEESEALVSNLLTLSSAYKCHIMCVLHANPNSDKARGHLGSTLMRKVESIMYVHKVGKDVSFVEPHNCRNEDFERFAFRIEEANDADVLPEECKGMGIPVECNPEEYESAKKENDCVRILREVFGGVADKRLLNNKLQELGNTQGNARQKIFRALQCGLLREKDGLVSIVEV